MNAKHLLFTITFISCLVFQSCKQNKKEPQKEPLKTTETEKTDPSNTITFIGVTDDPEAFEYINFLEFSYFNGTPHKDTIKKIKNDTLEIRLKAIEQPQILEFMAFGKKNFYNT